MELVLGTRATSVCWVSGTGFGVDIRKSGVTTLALECH